MRVIFLHYPIHPETWNRPAGNVDYRITADYDSTDLINGGMHRACDVGNFREGDPVHAPADCTAVGMRHFDGALGVRFSALEGYAWELWHLDTLRIGLQPASVIKGQIVGTTGNSGRQPMPMHTHIELEKNSVRIDPKPYLLGVDFPWFAESGDTVPRLRPVREQWDIPAGTEFWLDGPEQGEKKVFTSLERRWSNSETDDTRWRLIEYDTELLWVKRADIVPIANTRNPRTGYGTPAMGISEATAKSREQKAADAVLEASKAAAKRYGAS